MKKSKDMLSYNVLFCISKSFGYMVVIMTPIAKLPTIVKVICVKSGEGISKIATLMEITGYAIFTSFAFSMNFRTHFMHRISICSFVDLVL